MPSYTYTSEQAKQETITNLEQAKSVIIATATARMEDKEELLQDPDILAVANAFDIDLHTVQVIDNPDYNGFPFLYEFKEV